MNKPPLNHHDKDQLPLFGQVYSEDTREYEYLLIGIKVANRLLRPTWEQPSARRLPGEGDSNGQRRYVWLGV